MCEIMFKVSLTSLKKSPNPVYEKWLMQYVCRMKLHTADFGVNLVLVP